MIQQMIQQKDNRKTYNNKVDKVDKENNNNTLVEKIVKWAYGNARVQPSCTKEAFRKSLQVALDRVGELKVKRYFEQENNAISFLKNIKTL